MGTRHLLARTFKSARRTAGDISLNSTSWVNVDTGLDLTLAAAIGDVIEVGINGMANAEATSLYLDVVTLVAGSPAGSFGATAAAPGASPPNYGVPAWSGANGVLSWLGAPVHKTIVAGDLASGYVTLRLRGATGGGVAKTLRADGTNWSFEFWARNIGPADPN